MHLKGKNLTVCSTYTADNILLFYYTNWPVVVWIYKWPSIRIFNLRCIFNMLKGEIIFNWHSVAHQFKCFVAFFFKFQYYNTKIILHDKYRKIKFPKKYIHIHFVMGFLWLFYVNHIEEILVLYNFSSPSSNKNCNKANYIKSNKK